MEVDLLSAELTVLLLHSSTILIDGFRVTELPVVYNALTHEDVEDGF